MRFKPLVSVCMPAYNAARWIGEAIDSVLDQTYPEFELIVSDNASTDETAAIVSSYRDRRIRLDTTSTVIPPVANHNRSVSLSKGTFVKFLHADDLLKPTCLEEMVSAAVDKPRVGLVFAPREILLDDPDDEANLVWRREHRDLNEHFGELRSKNEGRVLFRQILASGITSNWIGEPSAVMVSRQCLSDVGLFNVRIRQIADLDLWIRIMLAYDVCYIPRTLSAYRHHARSVTAMNARLGRDWLDRLWLLEALNAEPSLSSEERTAVHRLRKAALRPAVRSQARHLISGRFWAVGDLLSYCNYRTRVLLGRAPRLSPELGRATEQTPRRCTAASGDPARR
jgi:glycosyltransferase involved in cell wall biosynthesis